MRVLVVEDDLKLQRMLRRGLSEAGFEVEVAADGECALDLASRGTFEAVVLDLMIPRIPGMEVLKRLRREKLSTPVLVLTARDSPEDKISGLDGGADDYVTKPFVFAEVVARLRALIRRATGVESAVIRIGDLEIDTAHRRAKRRGQLLPLRAREYALLEFLAMRRGQVVSRAQVFDYLFGPDSETLSNTMDVHVSRLRNAIDRGFDRPLLHTIRGQGYRLDESA